MNLIKGHGGALLREKIVASVSRRFLIVIHGEKLVSRLAIHYPLPAEVVPFGWQVTARQLERLGAKPSLRLDPSGNPYRSDGGNFILDCVFKDVFRRGRAGL